MKGVRIICIFVCETKKRSADALNEVSETTNKF